VQTAALVDNRETTVVLNNRVPSVGTRGLLADGNDKEVLEQKPRVDGIAGGHAAVPTRDD